MSGSSRRRMGIDPNQGRPSCSVCDDVGRQDVTQRLVRLAVASLQVRDKQGSAASSHASSLPTRPYRLSVMLVGPGGLVLHIGARS